MKKNAHVTIRMNAHTNSVTVEGATFDRSGTDDKYKEDLVNVVVGWAVNKFKGNPNFRPA